MARTPSSASTEASEPLEQNGATLRGGRVLLFVDGRTRQANRHAIACASAVTWPTGVRPEVVDVAVSRELADWYGIVRVPAVAVVADGMLIAIEHECTDPACARLLDAATRRAAQMRGRTL